MADARAGSAVASPGPAWLQPRGFPADCSSPFLAASSPAGPSHVLPGAAGGQRGKAELPDNCRHRGWRQRLPALRARAAFLPGQGRGVSRRGCATGGWGWGAQGQSCNAPHKWPRCRKSRVWLPARNGENNPPDSAAGRGLLCQFLQQYKLQGMSRIISVPWGQKNHPCPFLTAQPCPIPRLGEGRRSLSRAELELVLQPLCGGGRGGSGGLRNTRPTTSNFFHHQGRGGLGSPMSHKLSAKGVSV